eukprot:UN10849
MLRCVFLFLCLFGFVVFCVVFWSKKKEDDRKILYFEKTYQNIVLLMGFCCCLWRWMHADGYKVTRIGQYKS